MSNSPIVQPVPTVKKSVALSGIEAGHTAICSVGANGRELRYRGYEINDLANHATYEEVAHLCGREARKQFL